MGTMAQVAGKAEPPVVKLAEPNAQAKAEKKREKEQRKREAEQRRRMAVKEVGPMKTDPPVSGCNP